MNPYLKNNHPEELGHYRLQELLFLFCLSNLVCA